jgi:hypothetical protein
MPEVAKLSLAHLLKVLLEYILTQQRCRPLIYVSKKKKLTVSNSETPETEYVVHFEIQCHETVGIHLFQELALKNSLIIGLR